MGASLEAYKVAAGERSNFAKFDGLLDTLEASLGAIGDPSLNGFGTGLILDPSQLKSGGATTGQTLIHNGTLWVPTTLGTRTVFTKTSTVDVVGTVSGKDLFTGVTLPSASAGILIPANTVGNGDRLRIVCGGDYLNQSGASRNFTLALVWLDAAGSTSEVVWSDTSTNRASNATRSPWHLRGQIQFNHDSGAAGFRGLFSMNDTTAATTGSGALKDPSLTYIHAPIGGSGASGGDLGFSVDRRLMLSVALSAADAALSFRLFYARLEALNT